MVDTTTPKQVRFDDRPPQDLSLLHALVLGKRLRRMKRRLFLDAVAENQGKTTDTTAAASRRVVDAACREEEEKNETVTSRFVRYTYMTPTSGFDTASDSLSEDQTE